MALFPEVQEKARVELDQVVGSNRMPDFDDIGQMPYIRAVVMETLRWTPVTPFGIPHALIADDEYNGYHIPKGTTIVPVRVPVFLYLLRNWLNYRIERLVSKITGLSFISVLKIY